MVDSPEWFIAKAAGDAGELVIADWFRSVDFQTYKTLGIASFDLLLQATVEVKTDLLSEKTGNVAVEVMYNGQSSGIHTSRATYWVFVLRDEALLIRTPKLRDFIGRSDYEEKPAGDGYKSVVKLVPVKSLRTAPGVQRIPLQANAKPPRTNRKRTQGT